MKCLHVRRWLSMYHDGRPAGPEATGVATHLRGCAVCRLLRGQMSSLENEVRSTVEWQLDPSSNLRRSVIDRWLAERAAVATMGRRPYFLAWPNQAVHSCLLVVVVVAALLFVSSLAQRQRGVRDRRQGQQIVRTVEPGQHVPAPPPATPLSGNRQRQHGLSRPGALGGTKHNGAPHLLSHDSNDDPSTAPQRHSRGVGDLDYWNTDPEITTQQWASMTEDDWDKVERKVRQAIRAQDDFVQIPFPRIAGTGDRPVVAAVEAYKREAAVIDARLVREVTVAFKATALSDLCDHLRADTGIQLSAGPSVADEKVTIFCEKLPLREVMRQLSRPFGYTWLRSKKEGGEYRYELVQDLKSQLLEEELRNHDRDAALIDLDREMSGYRPYLSLSPDEALARARTARPEEKKWLEQLAGWNWGPIQIYFRLSPQELAALRSGQKLAFSQAPKPGEETLPADMARGVLECLRDVRFVRREGGYDSARPKFNAESLPLTAIPEARAGVALSLDQSELGQYTLQGSSRFTTGSGPNDFGGGRSKGPFAVGTGAQRRQGPAEASPDDALASGPSAHDPALRPHVSVQPVAGCRSSITGPASVHLAILPASDSRHPADDQKLTSVDVLEALHRASGMPIIADFYTRLYPVHAVSVRDRPIFETLNRLADAMRLRWNKDGSWLQFRSTRFYNDRLKEVPNRLLSRWSEARRQHGILTLDDLVEIAQLPDAQLDAAEMAEGARDCWGLNEWDLARGREQRPHLRYLAQLTPAQRQEALGATGLAFTRMSLPQQQQFLSLMLGSRTDALQSLEELAGATFRIAYTQPGGFEWPGLGPATVLQFRPSPVRERTREAAIDAARRINPQVDPARIVPTDLALTILYRCNPRPDAFVFVIRATPSGCTGYDGRPRP